MPMRAQQADITTLTVDAIVNSANEELQPGGGVSAAIHNAAGPELAEACERIGYCPTGEARITSAFCLPSRFVVHAVGPVWEGGDAGEAELLASAYRHALLLAHMHRSESIALPAISTGIFNYPLREAAKIAVATAREALERGEAPPEVIFVCHSPEGLAAFTKALASDSTHQLPTAP
ncbi:MAG: macro domain-containing protein [Gemmatimonadales bacterium]|nr:macro domain-containing protein [Gemmatimonadales bacterium]